MISAKVVVLVAFSVAAAKPIFHFGDLWRQRSGNAEEESGNLEGDMILSSQQVMDLNYFRTGLINLKYRWPNRTVAYELAEDFTNAEADFIRKSLSMIEEVSCLRFVKKTSSHSDYIAVSRDETGCSSAVGYQTGAQPLNLAPNDLGRGCFRSGTIIHEFLHALGFFHMQSASDRDDYVEILWENINPLHQRNFNKYNDSVITHFGVQYDYGSVMHYPRTAFSITGEATIVPKDPNAEIGQRLRLSDGDVLRLNRMYECERRNYY